MNHSRKIPKRMSTRTRRRRPSSIMPRCAACGSATNLQAMSGEMRPSNRTYACSGECAMMYFLVRQELPHAWGTLFRSAKERAPL